MNDRSGGMAPLLAAAAAASLANALKEKKLRVFTKNVQQKNNGIYWSGVKTESQIIRSQVFLMKCLQWYKYRYEKY